MRTQVPSNPGIDNTLIEVEATKKAIYIEQVNKKTKEVMGWAGYIYANNIKNTDTFDFVKTGKDQWGNKVKVYRANNITHFESPNGITKTDLVVLV